MSYKLIFRDDFKVDGKPDPTIWNYETGGYGFGNNEDQYYTDRLENAYVQDGILNIVARKEDFENRHYTSAKLTTYQKYDLKYGKVKVRAKLPKGKGMWPAIWMLPNKIREGMPWPLCGEIDIMENVGKDPYLVHYSLHTEKYNHKINTQMTHIIKDEGIYDEFRTYEIRWDEERIEFYLDDKYITQFERRGSDLESWPFDHKYYLILNLAVGGNWGGEIDDSIFPQKFQFEFVELYKKE